MHRITDGFSLIELLVTLTIFSLIMVLATNSYSNYMVRAHRGDGMSLLLRVAAAQERYYLDENTYAGPDKLIELGFDPPTSEHGYYELAITPADPGGLTVGYTATVTPTADSRQQRDLDCALFSIDGRGFRDSSPEPADVCWR